MQFDPAQLALLFGIATIANGIIEAIVKPLFEKFELDNFWLMYAAWFVAGVLSFLANLNIFGGVFASAIVGQVLTAVIAGRASNILHDLSDQKSNIVIANIPADEGKG